MNTNSESVDWSLKVNSNTLQNGVSFMDVSSIVVEIELRFGKSCEDKTTSWDEGLSCVCMGVNEEVGHDHQCLVGELQPNVVGAAGCWSQ